MTEALCYGLIWVAYSLLLYLHLTHLGFPPSRPRWGWPAAADASPPAPTTPLDALRPIPTIAESSGIGESLAD